MNRSRTGLRILFISYVSVAGSHTRGSVRDDGGPLQWSDTIDGKRERASVATLVEVTEGTLYERVRVSELSWDDPSDPG